MVSFAGLQRALVVPDGMNACVGSLTATPAWFLQWRTMSVASAWRCKRDHQTAPRTGKRSERYYNGKSCVAKIVMTGSARTI